MSRKRKPHKLKVQEGSRIRDPERIEPQPRAGEPLCPDEIKSDTVAWAKWCEIVVLLDDMGLLTMAEADVMAAYCRAHSLLARAKKEIDMNGLTVICESERGVTTKRNPACADYWAAMEHIRKLMPELGLTPAGRAKLSAAPKEEESPLAKLANIA